MNRTGKLCPGTGEVRYLTSLLAGAVLLPVAGGVWAAEQQGEGAADTATVTTTTATASTGDGSRLDTITVEGNRLYDMLPSEQTGGYGVDAATVGTKTPAALRDIPQSISVVTREAIEDQKFNTLDELAKRTPGMRVLSNDAGRSSIYSRGYEYNEYNLDGLPAPMASILGTVPNLAAFDRIEIMRGPSGLFNSTSELGGIVNAVRKRPTDEFQGHVTGRYGSWDQNYVETDISGPINADGSVRGRLVVSNDDTNGFVDHNDNTNQTFYGALDVDLDEATTLSLAYLRQHRDLVTNNGLPTDTDGNLLDVTRSTFAGADWNSFEMQSNDYIAELTHQFEGGGYGRVAARYSDRSADFNYAFGRTGVSDDGTFTAVGLGGNVEQQSLSMDASYSQPFQTLGNVSEFVVGTDYKRYETDTFQALSNFGSQSFDTINDIAYVDIADNGAVRTNSRETLEEYGLYSKLTFRPVQDLALIAGGRLSNYSTHTRDYTDGSTGERSDDARFTPYAGLVYDLDRHHSLYASYSEVFNPQSEVDSSGTLLKPREGTQYEVGVKGSYFGGDLNARVSAFRLYDENYAAGVAGESYSAPIGKRRIQGAEFELTGSITDQWDVIAGYTYLDTEVEKGDDEATFVLMPKNTVNLWTQYGFEGGALDGFHVGGGVTALSDFHTAGTPQVDAPGYVVVDALVGYDFTNNLKGQLNFNNILDKKYYERVGSVGTFNMYGAPSSVVASLRYDF
ncbi:outer-membrane receptor for ferric coprogen and ferric-rhodotorulic acid [Kushneria avicenniae]|uniref:Outer-membrane receptor for ferric coprogen and ferric-rhodotorulic acid n=1 Tax=Kushneria avicenniae TaxID=402385 RepID=A0A1I1LWJ7_9GAMM|nr:TonB-dependent siderophore receptor [Kushneria avicenniae]SFC75318.1 outer-membrane receptor for ferric coprogen and ferric-rhodotorulic acid [Kushneria avicenniae]